MYVEYKGTKHCDDNVFNELISIPEWMFEEPIENDNIDVEDDNSAFPTLNYYDGNQG